MQSGQPNDTPSQPPTLECTYDEAPSEFWQDNTQTKFEQLESKIALLENLLRESNERIHNQELQISQATMTPLQQQSVLLPGQPSLVKQGLSPGSPPLEDGQSPHSALSGTPGLPSFQFSTAQTPAESSSPGSTPLERARSMGSSPAASSPSTHASNDRSSPECRLPKPSSTPMHGRAPIPQYLQPPNYETDITIEDQTCTVQALDAIGTFEANYDPYSTTIQLRSTDPEYQSFSGGFASITRHQARMPKVSPTTLVEIGVDPSEMTLDLGLGGYLLQDNTDNLSGETTVLHQAWPQFLPPPDLLLHLVDTFFTCHPHAGRILHRGNFMNLLTYPPTSPRFPLPALLHAICAVASFYTAVVDPPAMPPIHDMPPEEIFYDPKTQKNKNPSFGEIHAMWATLSAARAIQSGERMLQVVQSTLILAWFHFTSGSSVNVWILIGKACRITSPLGINISPAYGTLSRFNRTPALIPPPKTVIEAEQRRNLFWLIYSAERFHTAGTCWSMLLDDEDISQYFPIGDEDFNAGKEFPHQIRQRIGTRNALLVHPPEITSSFTLFVKSSVLLSKVKIFNVRFRAKYADIHTSGDPRDTAEFQELDKLLQEFKDSWPREFKEPISIDGKVDPTLYLASIVAPTATILLHDPHADFNSPTCPSAKRMTQAAAVIMDSMYKLSSTSFDVLLLDHNTSFSWFVAGACLIRILKAKMSTGATADMIRVNSEIDIVRMMLLRLGERTIIGRRQIKLLNDHYVAEINGPNQGLLRMFGAMAGKDVRQMFLNPELRLINPMVFENAASANDIPTVRDMLGAALPSTPMGGVASLAQSSQYLTPTQGSLGALLRSCSPGSASLAFSATSPLPSNGAASTPSLQSVGMANAPSASNAFRVDSVW